jgi:REP element-mobilizing transposase RayT
MTKGADKSVRATSPVIRLKSNPYQYRRRLPHMQGDNRPLFVTFCKLTPEPLPPRAELVLQHCLHDHRKTLLLHAAVVMPEHVHLRLTPLRDEEGWPILLSRILQRLKGASARSLNRWLGRGGPVWQEESFDHVLRSNESYEDKIESIRQNPVRRELAAKPEDYPWLWVGPM